MIPATPSRAVHLGSFASSSSTSSSSRSCREGRSPKNSSDSLRSVRRRRPQTPAVSDLASPIRHLHELQDFPEFILYRRPWLHNLAVKKVLLTKLPSLPPTFERRPNAVAEMTLAMLVYELAVLLSMKIGDQDAFERDFVQLKVFYMDTRGMIPPSPDEYPMLGLNLMRLLAENRIAEFHTELELLPLKALDHPCIKYAVELEQSFTEGAYNRLINARESVPDNTYLFFMDLLAETMRDEIADCSDQAYDHLSVNDAIKMLMFSSEQQLLEYISKRQHEWEVQNRSVLFHMAKPQPRACLQSFQRHSFQLIKQSLSYAQELEQVV